MFVIDVVHLASSSRAHVVHSGQEKDRAEDEEGVPTFENCSRAGVGFQNQVYGCLIQFHSFTNFTV